MAEVTKIEESTKITIEYRCPTTNLLVKQEYDTYRLRNVTDTEADGCECCGPIMVSFWVSCEACKESHTIMLGY